MKLAALLVLSLGACYDKERDYRTTPAGYQVLFENVGSVPDWYSLEEIHAIFDGAVEDAAVYLSKYGATMEQVKATARAYRFVVYDACRFPSNHSGTGWAAGSWSYQYRIIELAFWGRAKADVVPASAPAWTVYSWPSRPSPAYDYGVVPHLPAIGHEIGHAIYGGAFEH